MKIGVIITAGGTSSRFGNTNKLLEKINGKTVIEHTVNAFKNSKVDEIIICANKSIMEEFKNMFPEIQIIEGGTTRQESVFNGLQTITCDYILIHDGARPMITPEIINKTIDTVIDKKAVSVMTKTIDTIKEVDENGKIIKTLDRSKLYNTQTPQAFEYNLIKSVHEKLKGQNYTDDAGMAEELGYDVFIVEGDYRNIKITTKSDLKLAESCLK